MCIPIVYEIGKWKIVVDTPLPPPPPPPPPRGGGGGGGGEGGINHNFSFTYFIYDWNAHFAKDYTAIVHIEEISTEEFDIQKQSVQHYSSAQV